MDQRFASNGRAPALQVQSPKFKPQSQGWPLVAHTCNPSYSGGRDQEDRSSKPAQANSSRDPILKKTSQNRVGGVAQGVGSEFKP
jgi:hypothetical protein